MHEQTGNIDSKTLKYLKKVAKDATWKVVKGDGRDYLTSFCGDDVKKLFDWDFQAAFFLKIPPGGKVHPHVDVERPWSTFHVVVQTNAKCISYSMDDDKRIGFHPKTKGIYRVNRQLEHWAINNGTTDRIHLLCLVYE